MNKINEVMENLFNVKEKLTDQEYLDFCNDIVYLRNLIIDKTKKNLEKFNNNIEWDIGSIKANFVYDCPYLDLVINNEDSKSYYCDENLQFNQSYAMSSNNVSTLLALGIYH